MESNNEVVTVSFQLSKYFYRQKIRIYNFAKSKRWKNDCSAMNRHKLLPATMSKILDEKNVDE